MPLKLSLAGLLCLLSCPLEAEYTTGGLNGLFLLNNTRVSDAGIVCLAPQMAYEDYDGGTALRFLINGNYGIGDNAELGLCLPIVRASNGGSDTGIGDISVAGKYRFLRQKEGKPAIAAVARLDLPTADDAKGLGDALDFLASAVGDYTVGDVDLSGEIGVAMCGDIEVEQLDIPGPGKIKNDKIKYEINRGNYLFLGGGASYPINEKLDVLGELFLNGLNGRAGGGHVLNAGVSYSLGERTMLKGGLLIGLEDQAPDFGLIVGFGHAF